MADEDEFAALINEMVAEERPRLFAVVEELGERADARITGWGLAFEDQTMVMCDGGRSVLNLRSPDRMVQLMSHAPHRTARLVWLDG